MGKSIGELVLLARQDDQNAINELYNQTFKKAYFVARTAIKSSDGDYSSQIEDILQDAYVKAFSSLDKLEDPEKFQGWLDTIVINRCKDFLKKKKPTLFSDMASENSDDGSILDFEDSRENDRMEFKPEETVDYGETKRLIAEMLDRMPEDQKMCLLMYYYEEMSVRQIAEAMDCSEGTIKSRLNYARKNLKDQVLELEKKGTKLYCAPLFPFLYWFFRQQAEDFISGTAAAAVGSTVIKSTVSETGGSNIASGAAGAGAKTVAASAGKASLGLGAKIAITAVGAAIIVGGGAITVKTMAVKHIDKTTETVTVEESSEPETEVFQGGMNASARRKAYYELIRSMSTGSADQNAYNWNMDGLEKLEWSEADLDGDGVDEILFASGNYHAASVGIGKMVDGKAVYCGELGNSGALSYYPGIGYLMDDWTGGGGHAETLYSLSGSEIQLIAQANYSDEYNAITDEYDVKEYSGEINGAEVSTSEAQWYINNIKKQYGDGIAFQYGEAENHSFEELLK